MEAEAKKAEKEAKIAKNKKVKAKGRWDMIRDNLKTLTMKKEDYD